MRTMNQHILLLLDNAPSHPPEPTIPLTHVKLQYLPANTTSTLQPLDQGIIKTFKTAYRKQLLRAAFTSMETTHGSAGEIAKKQ